MVIFLQVLKNAVLFLILAPYDNEQSDLIHRVGEEKTLDEIPLYRYMNTKNIPTTPTWYKFYNLHLCYKSNLISVNFSLYNILISPNNQTAGPTSGSVNEELLALIYLIEGIFCPERSTKHKNLAQQFTTYSCNMAVKGYVE